METIAAIVVKYWVEALLGLIATGLGLLCKKFRKLYLAEKQRQKTEEQKAFYDGLKDCIKEASQLSRQQEKYLQEQINAIKQGILSIQGRQFKQQCMQFLEPEYEFTVREFEDLSSEHEIYNGLGGNHEGDSLFSLVEKKASNILTDDK